ncbi:MAG: L-fucokinase, partial [Thermoguttaceae bacterium]
MSIENWDYLILTASNEIQAVAYRGQLELRADLGLLTNARHKLVVADPGGRRVGSGGSTICCLMEVLCREMGDRAEGLGDSDQWKETLQRLRILIVHAGGDSRRLPAYSSCGKAFVPLPGPSDSALGTTLFDRQLPTYLALPSGGEGKGQIVITAGDVLLRFDPLEVQWKREGMSGLGCLAAPEEASRHGVFCLAGNGHVRRFLQKPPVEVQAQERAITAYGQSALDMGVFSFDAQTAVRLLELSDVRPNEAGALDWTGPMGCGIEDFGLDFYREVACAFGTETTLANYQSAARSGGSRWSDDDLHRIYDALHDLPFSVHVVRQCEFLHFGASRQIITSGQQLVRSETGFTSAAAGALCMNSRLDGPGSIDGGSCWIEGCSIAQPVSLAGENVLVGVDVDRPLELPAKACLDLLPGRDRTGQPVTFVRCYGIDDTSNGGSGLCGETLDWWAEKTGGCGQGLWDACATVGWDQRAGTERSLVDERRPTVAENDTEGMVGRRPPTPDPQAGTPGAPDLVPPYNYPHSAPKPGSPTSLWNARIFPAAADAADYRRWLWLFNPKDVTAEQWEAWRQADRYSFEEMATLADQDAFHGRRMRLHAEAIERSLCRWFRHDSGFSAADLAHTLENCPAPGALAAAVLREARRREESQSTEPVGEAFSFARTIHTLGSALQQSIRHTPCAVLLRTDHTGMVPGAGY